MEKKLKKFGNKQRSKKDGEFNSPCGITIDTQFLYVCDKDNNRVQVLDKENGKFIYQCKNNGKRLLDNPLSILLYENLLYVGDWNGIQVYSKQNKCIKYFGNYGTRKGEFKRVTSLCIINDQLYIIDSGNNRIQVWIDF